MRSSAEDTRILGHTAHHASTLLQVVGQLRRTAIDEVRLWIIVELDSWNSVDAVEERSTDTVHTVHHAALRIQNDGVPEIACQDEFNVPKNAAWRWLHTFLEIPMVLVQLRKSSGIYLPHCKIPAQVYQSPNIPCINPLFGSAKMVLRADQDLT